MKGTKVKSSKGITLVALVITIIILLILAIVAIAAVNGDGIIGKAKEAGSSYNEKATAENTELARQLGLIEGALGKNAESGSWKDNGDGTITKGGVTVKIGDFVNYDPTNGGSITTTYTSYSSENKSAEKNNGRTSGYTTDQTFSVGATTNGWRVLGVDQEGNLELISADPINATNGEGYYLSGIEGYNNAEEELNAICSIFGQGKGAAGGRSLNIEDIEKLSGPYNPEEDIMNMMGGNNYGKIYKFGYSTVYSCVKVKEAINETDTSLDGINDAEGGWKIAADKLNLALPFTTLETPYWTIDSTTTEAKTLINNMWSLYMIQDTAKVIKCKHDGTPTVSTLLASRYVSAGTSGVEVGVRNINETAVMQSCIYRCGTNAPSYSSSIRPVVSLASNVELTGNSTDGWNIQ